MTTHRARRNPTRRLWALAMAGCMCIALAVATLAATSAAPAGRTPHPAGAASTPPTTPVFAPFAPAAVLAPRVCRCGTRSALGGSRG